MGQGLHGSADFHVDLADVRTEEGQLRLFVAIDHTSKLVSAELHPSAGKM